MPVTPKDKLLGLEEVMGRLAEVAQLKPSDVLDILAKQIDFLAIATNDMALSAIAQLRAADASLEDKATAIKMLASLGFFSDSVSRQRLALSREFAVLPGGADRPGLERPKELSDSDWEKKYAQFQQLPAGSEPKQ